MESMAWKALALLSLVAAFVALIIGIIAVDKAAIVQNAGQSAASPNFEQYPTSCSHLASGKPSGVYTIRPTDVAIPFPVYCDMNTGGGGWTLVASVHENHIRGKCTFGDKWSSEQGTSVDGKLTSKNWENMNVFGQVDSLTSDDYKSPAYFSLDASNIMLWHVPNGKSLAEIDSSAFLKYYSNNNFLKKYGGHLQNLYQKELPISKQAGSLDPLFNSINTTIASIRKDIATWYQYRYDNTRTYNSISDGGGDMYDNGNKVYYRVNGQNFSQMTYNAPYFLYANGVEVKSSRTYPFLALAWIGSGLDDVESNVDYFDYRVVSNYGADGRGNLTWYVNQTITEGSMRGEYSAFNIFQAGDPSICEVFFYYGSESLWGTTFPTGIEEINWSTTTREASNIARFGGSPRNVIVGYTLLSKQGGVLVTQKEIETVLKRYMRSSVDFKFVVKVPHIYTPVVYALGNDDEILSGIPRSQRDYVDPGYIQFRAFNSVGLPNALCPGVKVRSNNPEQVCIGGTSTARVEQSVCGDYAGWGGAPRDPGNETSPSNTGKSLRDIQSSILLFLR